MWEKQFGVENAITYVFSSVEEEYLPFAFVKIIRGVWGRFHC